MTENNDTLRNRIQQEARDSAALVERFITETAAAIEQVLDVWVHCLTSGGKILLAGNGGSAADCQHFAGELVGGFPRKGRALAAVALTTDTSVLTAVGNDYGFDHVFSRQVEALAKPGDLLVLLSTSGNSPNLVHAATAARNIPITVTALLGNNGGALSDKVDHALIVPSNRTDRIQECHTVIGHILCRLTEEQISAQPKLEGT